MKYKKNLAALLLSIAVLAGTALPSFAEPETEDTDTPTTSETTPDTEDTDDTTTDTDAEGEDTDDSSSSDAADQGEGETEDGSDAAAPPEEEPLNQTGSIAEDGSALMTRKKKAARFSISCKSAYLLA